MLATFVVVWRESLEAALVVAILLAYLKRIGQRDKYRYIYYGVLGALIACLGFVRLSAFLEGFFEGRGEEVFQAGVMLAAVVVVTAMVLWMHVQARSLRGSLENRAGMLIEGGQLMSLALLAGIAVFREGAETTLFLWSIALSAHASATQMLIAGAAGATVAVVMAYFVFQGAAHLNLKLFFQVTAIVLILIAAGILAQAANKLIGVGLLPPGIGQIWNTSWLLDERGPLGSMAAALFGYRSRPSLTEAMVYVLYFPLVFFLMRWPTARPQRLQHGEH